MLANSIRFRQTHIGYLQNNIEVEGKDIMIMRGIQAVTFNGFKQSRVVPTTLRAIFAIGLMSGWLCFAPPASAAGPLPFNGTVAAKVDGIPIDPTNPDIYSVYLIGVGQTNLGKAIVAAHHFTKAATGMLVGGVLVLTLPGGEIFGTYSGTEGPGDEPDQVAITGTITFTGGTGKFRKISGSAGFSSVATITNITKRGVVKEDLALSFDGVLANINAQ